MMPIDIYKMQYSSFEKNEMKSYTIETQIFN